MLPSPAAAPRRTVPHPGWLLLILLGGALLRFLTLGGESYWLDEYHSLNMARSYPLLTGGLPGDQHPPAYYLLLTRWIQVSEHPFWVRLPSAAAGTAAIWVMARIGVALGRRRLGLLAAFLLAFAPLLIWYSREARMYGVAQLAWVAAIYFYVQILRRDRRSDSLGLALAHLAGLYLAYPGLALWLGQMGLFPLLWVHTGRSAPRLRRWLTAQAVVVAGFAPWLPFMARQLGRTTRFNWQLPGLALSPTLGQVLSVALGAAALGVLAGAGAAVLAARRPGLLRALSRRAGLWAVIILLLFLPLYAAGIIPRGLSIRRQLLVFLPPLILLAAWALLRLDRRRLTGGVAALALLLGVGTYFLPPYQDWRGAFTHLAVHEAPGDVLLLYRFWYRVPLGFEYRGNLAGDAVVNLEELARDAAPPFPVGSRVWILTYATPDVAPDVAAVQAWLAAAGTLEEQRRFWTNLELRAYRMGGENPGVLKTPGLSPLCILNAATNHLSTFVAPTGRLTTITDSIPSSQGGPDGQAYCAGGRPV